MNVKDLLLLGLKGMSERRLRTGLTVLSVVVGVTAIVALISLTSGVSTSISQTLNKIGPTTIFLTPSGTGILTEADVAEIASFPNVSSVVPMLRFGADINVGGQTQAVTIYGVDNSSINSTIGGVDLYSGTTYNGTLGPYALVGHDVAFPNTGQVLPSISVNQPIYLSIPTKSGARSVTLLPVGILNAYGSAFFVSPDSSIFVPLQEAESLAGRTSYNMIVVKASNTSSVAALDTLLSDVYNGKASIISVQQLTSTVSSVIGSISLLLGGIASISLLVAGISILSIMMVSVTERTHEIGILKSIGFRRKDVMFLFLSEAVIIGVLGGVLGTVLGSGAAYALPVLLSGASSPGTGSGAPSGAVSTGSGTRASGGGGNEVFVTGSGNGAQGQTAGSAPASSSSSGLSSFAPDISPGLVGIAIFMAVVVSVAASLYPAWKASRIDPIRALRSE